MGDPRAQRKHYLSLRAKSTHQRSGVHRAGSCNAQQLAIGIMFREHFLDIAIHVVERFQFGIERMVRERIVSRSQYLAVLPANGNRSRPDISHCQHCNEDGMRRASPARR